MNVMMSQLYEQINGMYDRYNIINICANECYTWLV